MLGSMTVCLLLEAPANGASGCDNRTLEYAVEVSSPSKDKPNGAFSVKKVRNALTKEPIDDVNELPPLDAVRTALQTELWAAENQNWFDPNCVDEPVKSRPRVETDPIVDDDYGDYDDGAFV